MSDRLEPFFVQRGYPDEYDGLVLSGGCALNVLANSFLERRFGVRVWVPPAPGDGGLVVGAAWQVQQPPRARGVRWEGDREGLAQRWERQQQPLQYAGPPLFDKKAVPSIVEAFQRNATEQPTATRLFGGGDDAAAMDALAGLLACGAVVGVARGRSEFGPRALGHRSLLACPAHGGDGGDGGGRGSGSKDKLNRIKFRQWWRPVAPIVAVEDALRVFETLPRSPYMTFAPPLRPEAKEALPAIAHFDGTARPQVVAAADEPWLHALLMAVRNRTGWAVLINTSFNVRGRPILNRAAEAVGLLRGSPEIAAVLVEDWLLELRSRRRHNDDGDDGSCLV